MKWCSFTTPFATGSGTRHPGQAGHPQSVWVARSGRHGWHAQNEVMGVVLGDVLRLPSGCKQSEFAHGACIF